jgi:hypothetical protein
MKNEKLADRIREAMQHPSPNYLYRELAVLLPEIEAMERQIADQEIWLKELKRECKYPFACASYPCDKVHTYETFRT